MDGKALKVQAQRIRVHSWLMVLVSLACIYRSSTGRGSDMIKYIIARYSSLPLSARLERLYRDGYEVYAGLDAFLITL